jgi:hypothetical protein
VRNERSIRFDPFNVRLKPETDNRRPYFTNYPALRAALDVLLVNRLPDVVLVTAGGRGAPMLAASYGAANGLVVVTRVADFRRFPLDAEERRDAFVVNEANAAVVVWDGRDSSVRRVLELVERKGIPVHVIGAPPKKAKARRECEAEPPRRGLPD